MKILSRAPDGGAASGVTAFFLIEAKSAFSIALLHFRPGTREAFHSHAFNALTIWLRGRVREHHTDGRTLDFRAGQAKLTPRSTFHKIEALGPAWALTFRGPWIAQWKERRPSGDVTLTHGRKEVPGDPSSVQPPGWHLP